MQNPINLHSVNTLENQNAFTKYFVFLISYLVTIITPLVKVSIGVGILVIFDLILAIIASHKEKLKNNETKSLWDSIESNKLKSTVLKGAAYQASLVVSLVTQYLFIPEVNLVKIVAGLIFMAEIKSLDEKIKLITGNSVLKVLTQYFKK